MTNSLIRLIPFPHQVKSSSVILLFIIFINLLGFSGCRRQTNAQSGPAKIEIVEIKKIKIILETSGSMEGFFAGDSIKTQVTNLISDLDRISKSGDKELKIGELDFFTIDDQVKLKHYADDAYSFNNKISNKKFCFVKSSPIDDIIKYIVDSVNVDDVSIIVSDMVIDKNIKNPLPTIQSNFNLIFNTAPKRDKGLIIYRFLGDFKGRVHPAVGKSFIVSGIDRPYFIWMIGRSATLKMMAKKLSASTVFNPKNIMAFGVNYKNPNYSVLHLSNREGIWKYREGKLIKCDLKNNKFKFTVGLDFYDFPIKQFEDINALQYKSELRSHTIKLASYKYYSRDAFRKFIHPKDSELIDKYSHYLEVSVGGFQSEDNTLTISFNKSSIDWPAKYTTEDDSYFNSDNNLNTFALKQIIDGINNAYGELSNDKKLFNITLILER